MGKYDKLAVGDAIPDRDGWIMGLSRKPVKKTSGLGQKAFRHSLKEKCLNDPSITSLIAYENTRSRICELGNKHVNVFQDIVTKFNDMTLETETVYDKDKKLIKHCDCGDCYCDDCLYNCRSSYPSDDGFICVNCECSCHKHT